MGTTALGTHLTTFNPLYTGYTDPIHSNSPPENFGISRFIYYIVLCWSRDHYVYVGENY